MMIKNQENSLKQIFDTDICLPGVSVRIFDKMVHLCDVRISEFMAWILPGFPACAYRVLGASVFRQEDFRVRFLSDREIIRLNSFKTLKKQTEWLCGRFALKNLVLKKTADAGNLARISISSAEEGAPYLPDLPECAVSISHSHDYAIAGMIINPYFRIGVDIEKISPVNSKYFLDLAFSENEKMQMENTDDSTIISKWSMKEAVLKFIGKGFHHPLKKAEILGDAVFIGGKKLDRIHSRSLRVNREYILSIVYGHSLCRQYIR